MDFNSIKPHLIVIVTFLALTMVYFMPVLKGKKLAQHDVVQSHAMAKEVIDYHEETGDYALWTGRMFSGMPVIQIWLGTKTNAVKHAWLGFRSLFASPIDVVLIYLFGFYFFLIVIGFKPTLAALGALGFAFSSYNFIIIEAGHLAKVMALGFAAPILAGLYLILKEKYLKGFVVTSIAVGFEIMSNHIQITYYLFFVIVFWVGFEFFESLKNKTLPKFAMAICIMALAGIAGILPNTTPLITTKDYVEETIRGEQELSTKKIDGNGLDRSYATNWSYGKLETMTLLFPNFMGGGSGGKLDKNSSTYEVLISKGLGKKQAEGFLQSLPLYWGPQQFISGPIYFGAIIILLALLGIFLSKDRSKWWLISATLFCIFISWGRNMEWFYGIFFDYLPLFNKFRSPSMILSVANITTIWLALLGLKAIVDLEKKDAVKVLKYGGGVAGFALVIALLGSSLFDFESQYVNGGVSSDDRFEQRMTQMTKSDAFARDLMEGIKEDRASMLSRDAWRSFLLITIALWLLYFFLLGKIKQTHLGIALSILILGDLWMVDKRYLNNDDFKKLKDISKNFSLSPAESKMLQDKDPHYRVLNTTVNIFNDASPAYYYKTIGGYHAAKLKRYQDLIENQISSELGKLNSGFSNTPILNMLNMKYIVFGKQENEVALNDLAMGNAWIVNQVIPVNNADEEMANMNNFDPTKEAIIDNRFKEMYAGFEPKPTSSGKISLSSYGPENLVYSFNSNQQEMVIFSEVFYHGNEDWVSFVDGVEKPHFRANYILRGMLIPSGEHTIEFKFKPRAYNLGENISLAGSGILILGLIALIIKSVRKPKED